MHTACHSVSRIDTINIIIYKPPIRWEIYGENVQIDVTGWMMILHIHIPGMPYKVRVTDTAGKVVP